MTSYEEETETLFPAELEGKSNRFQNKAADKISIFFPWIITN